MRTPVDPSPEGAGVSLTPWWLTTPCPTTGPSTTSTDGSTVWSVDSPGGATHEEHSPRPTHGSSRGHRGCHRRSRALLRGEFVFRSLTYHRAIHLPQQSMLRLGFRVTPPLGGATSGALGVDTRRQKTLRPCTRPHFEIAPARDERMAKRSPQKPPPMAPPSIC